MSYALAEPLDTRAQLRLSADEEREEAPADPDAPIVERVKSGDRRAFDEIVRRYQRPIYYVVLRYLKNEADSADVTQRTFVRVFKSIGRFRGASSFRTWIYRIAINLSLNHIRDHKRERPSEINDDAMVTEPVGIGAMVRSEESALLRAAVELLPPKQKMVLELRIYDELPFRDISALVGCTENAAKVNFHHAMKRLRSRMAGDER